MLRKFSKCWVVQATLVLVEIEVRGIEINTQQADILTNSIGALCIDIQSTVIHEGQHQKCSGNHLALDWTW
jgi:hypothetical protein